MIQSVSIRRVLPPKVLVRQGKKKRVLRNTQYPQKLNGQNLKLLESAITSAVGYGDYQSIRDERNHLRQANQQMLIYTTELDTQNEALQYKVQQKAMLAEKYAIQREILIDWTMNINSSSRADAIKSIEEKIHFPGRGSVPEPPKFPVKQTLLCFNKCRYEMRIIHPNNKAN